MAVGGTGATSGNGDGRLLQRVGRLQAAGLHHGHDVDNFLEIPLPMRAAKRPAFLGHSQVYMSVFAIRSAGKRSSRCPGCALRSRFDFGFPTGGVAPNGWTDGGVDDLFAAVSVARPTPPNAFPTRQASVPSAATGAVPFDPSARFQKVTAGSCAALAKKGSGYSLP